MRMGRVVNDLRKRLDRSEEKIALLTHGDPEVPPEPFMGAIGGVGWIRLPYKIKGSFTSPRAILSWVLCSWMIDDEYYLKGILGGYH